MAEITQTGSDPASCLAGGGAMGRLMRAKDWGQTPLGPLPHWPQSLRTAVSICLNSRFAIILWWGPELAVLYNDDYVPFLGIKHPGVLGGPGRDCWPEIWAIVGPMLRSVLTTGQATRSDDLLLLLERHGYPEECYFTFSYSPIRDESGGIGGVFTPVAETTEKVIGERRLTTLRDLARGGAQAKCPVEACRAAIETLSANPYDVPFALLYLRDADGKTARLVGSAGIAADSAASPASIALAPGASSAWPVAEVFAAGAAETVQGLAERFGALPGGAWGAPPRTALVLPLTIPGQDRPAAVLVAAVSPRKALDPGHRSFFDLLAGQVAAALADATAYEQERRRAEALAELDRAKTAFFSNVSHEFRTPLTLMLSPIEELLSDRHGLSSEQREQLRLVQRNGERLLKLVNTLLDFARIEAGRVQASFAPLDLARATAELASTFRSAVEKAGLRLIVDCPPLAEPVYVDRDMWEKIVLNLVSNAFKFTFAGEIEVALRAGDDAVTLSVRDTGAGVAESELPHLFERFHRVEGALGRTHEGTGIGLAVVQELARQHGGGVGVASRLGRGTTFTVTLPLGHAHLPAERVGAAPAPAGSGARLYVEEALRWLPAEAPENASAPDGRLRILLADDNADIRDYVGGLLGERYEIETASDGAAALEAIRRRRPDLLLSDVMMPGLDGFQLLRAIRGDSGLRELPVILLSARAGEEASIEGLAAGADDYLVKPFSARELVARVGATLAMARLRKAAAERERALRLAAEAAEEKLRRLNQTLEQRVLDEVSERRKTEAALFQAQKLEAVGALTGGIAHDFNNILTSVIGSVDLIAGARDTPERSRRLARAALRSAERGARLTQQLLAFARRQDLRPETANLGGLLKEMQELLHRAAGGAIEVTIAAPANLWECAVDTAQFEATMLNLIVNARDAMPEGGNVSLSLANQPRADGDEVELPPGDYVEVTVRDTGHGMAPEILARALEPFFTTKEIGKGTGLGLSMVYGFARQSGGTARIDSAPGAGTTVRLYLPRASGAKAGAEARGRHAAASRSGRGAVLFVEDDEDVRQVTVDVLRDLGYSVTVVSDAPTALRVIRSDEPLDLLLSDVVMPAGMSGRELAREAQRLRPELKVLLISGYSDRDAEAPPDDDYPFLGKPFRAADLGRAVAELLGETV